MRTACVTIRDRDGRPFVHVTMAATVFEAVANGIEWFADPYWHGPKPRKDTVYEVDVVGDGRRWKVRGGSVERWRARQSVELSALDQGPQQQKYSANQECDTGLGQPP